MNTYQDWVGRSEEQVPVTPLFFDLLKKIAGQPEIVSVDLVRKHAPQLTLKEFHLLLGRAIRQPEWLEKRLKGAMQQMGRDLNGEPITGTTTQ